MRRFNVSEQLGNKCASVIAAMFAVVVVGCVSPADRFAEFAERFPDAAPVDDSDAAPVAVIPNILGRSLVGLSTNIAPDKPLFFVLDVTSFEVLPSGAEMSVEVTPLDYAELTSVGATYTQDAVAVNDAGQFTIEVPLVVIPPAANPVTMSELTVENVTFEFSIKSEDFSCGVLGGRVTSPAVLDLTGSTIGAVRAADDATGPAMPPPALACP